MNDRAFIYGERWNIGVDWTRWLVGVDWLRTARFDNGDPFAAWMVTGYVGPFWLQVHGLDPSEPAA